MEDNVTLTVKVELSQETFKHISNIENLDDLLKLEVERKIYKYVLEDIQPSKCEDCGSMGGRHSQQCRIK